MSTTEAEYSKRAEECLRLAGAYIAESNRQILLYAAVHWRMLAEEAAGKRAQWLILPGQTPRAIAQELEAHGVRTRHGRDR